MTEERPKSKIQRFKMTENFVNAGRIDDDSSFPSNFRERAYTKPTDMSL